MAEFRLSNFTSGTALTAAELNTGLTYTDYTPTWTQSVAITKTVNWARYTIFGKIVHVSIKMTSTGAGTANNVIKVGLPVNASSNNYLMGGAITFRTATTSRYCIFDTASTVKFTKAFSDAQASTFHGETAADGWTIASGDVYYLNLTYEAA